MPQQVFGRVKPSSITTALRATNNSVAILSQPITQAYHCQAIQFQALSTNTGSVYVVDRQTPDLNLHVVAEIPAPAAGVLPAWVIGDTKLNLDVSTFWILPAVANEGLNVTALQAQYV
jgi:hypothetical protein